MRNILAVLFLYATHAFAQTTFMVENAGGSPAGGASVYYHRKLIAYTDKSGKVLIPGRIPYKDSVQFVLGPDQAWFVGDNGTTASVTYIITLNGGTREAAPFGETGHDVPAIPEPPADQSEPEEPAQFPGGTQAMEKFIENKLVIPPSVKKNGFKGKCYVSFVVNEDGRPENIRVVRSLMDDCRECDQQAIRVVKSMPNWIPAKAQGKPVRSQMTIPVAFR